MPHYSPRANRALAFLKAPYNDIEVFVEDTTCLNMYVFIIRRILGPGIKLRSVNGVGNRAAVIALCRADQVDTVRKRIILLTATLIICLAIQSRD